MEERSFRDILARFLEEKTEIPPLKTPPPTPETPLFHWENLELKPQPPKNAYPKPPKRAKPAPELKPAPPEPKWRISELNAVEQQQIKKLVQLGATEINGEISLSILKKAHRRLARLFHPDTAKQKSQANFLALQSIYECLSKALSTRTTGRAI